MALGKSRFARGAPSTSDNPLPLVITSLTLRFLQFVFGVAVIGLYATDLHAAHKAHKYTDSKWGYAVAIATLSAITALVYMIPKVPSYFAFGWDLILL